MDAPLSRPLAAPLAGYLAGSQGSLYPSDFAGLQLWLDASSTPTGAVATWIDKSGNGNNATQGTASEQPINSANQQNGLPVLLGDGSVSMVLPSALYNIPNGDNTIFVVARTSLGTTQQRLINMTNGGSSRYVLEFSSTAGRVSFTNNATLTPIFVDGVTKNNYNIITAGLSGTAQSISINGGTPATDANGTNATTNAASIFSGTSGLQDLTGGIAEMILYNRALNDEEKSVVELYLGAKWGITLA